MALNRTMEPPIEIPKKIHIPEVEKLTLLNGIPFYIIHSPNQDVLRIEIIFDAGNIHETQRLLALATNNLCDDGTINYTAKQIAEKLDFFGASLQTECTSDYASLTLFTLGRFLNDTLPVVFEIITKPVFPLEEIDTYKVQQKQKLSVNNSKVDFIARKIFNEQVFGPNHPYGYRASELDIEAITSDGMVNFHKLRYINNKITIIAAGNLTNEVKKGLNEIFAPFSFDLSKNNVIPNATIQVDNSSSMYSERQDALQSAIRIGRKMFNKTHPDFAGMSILNTILGGYFGSRLMSNIREDKGYTYGIGSGLVSFKQEGYFFITTEVGIDVTNPTLKEIYYEISHLQEVQITSDELKTVKNYLSGAFLRSIDGPFAQADKWKGIYFYELGYDYYYNYLETIRSITSAELKHLACKYLNKNDLIEVVVGKK